MTLDESQTDTDNNLPVAVDDGADDNASFAQNVKTKAGELSERAKAKAKEWGECTREPREKAREYAREHPFVAVAGGLVAGVVLAAILPRPRTIARGARHLSDEIAAATSAAVAAVSAAGREQLSHLNDEAERIGDEVTFRLSEAAESGRRKMHRAGEGAKRLKMRAGHSAEIARIRLNARKEIAKARAQARIAKARSRF